MARDATPDKIKIVDDNFVNEDHRYMARILEDEWDAQSYVSDFGEEYDPHRTTWNRVYRRYFGVPESEFNDGIEDPRTFGQIRDQYGSYAEYRDRRKRGDIDIPGADGGESETMKERVTEREMQSIQEGYRRGYPDGFDDGKIEGWNDCLEKVREVGVENVERKTKDD